MDKYNEHFLRTYSYLTYVRIVSELEKYNQKTIEKYSKISSPLYEGKSNFDSKLINEILSNEFLDTEKIDCITYFLEYILYWTNTNISIDDKNKRFDFLSYFMNNINQVMENFVFKDTKSAEGYLIFSDFLNIKNKFAIKTPKEDSDARNLLFEYYIGKNFLNKLRRKTPNFMYTYGIFMCNSLLKKDSILSNKLTVNKSFCKGSDKKNVYVVYEKIEGKTLLDVIYNIKTEKDLNEIVNYILQIFFALDIAQREGEYVHNDLHTKNVMIRNINKSIQFVYKFDVNSYKMNLNSIATIIDFGMNRFVENGIPLGITTFNNLGIAPYMNNVCLDVYKFLISIVTSMYYYLHDNEKLLKNIKKRIIQILEMILSFFRDKKDYYDIIKTWDILLKNPDDKKLSKNFIDVLLKASDNYFSTIPIDVVFYNTVSPSSFLQHIESNFKKEWILHVSTEETDTNSILNINTNIYDPQFTEIELEDYLFCKLYKNDIYFSNYIKQKDTFYKMFNQKWTDEIDIDNCLVNQESLILNNNTYNDISSCIKIVNNIKGTDKLELFNKDTSINSKKYYENDIETLISFTEEMDKILKNININNLTRLFSKNNLNFIDIDLHSDNTKTQIRYIHDFLKCYEKYIYFVTCSFNLKLDKINLDKINLDKFDLSKFKIERKYIEITTIFTFCIKKYYSFINSYYFMKLIEYQKIGNFYNFYNFSVIIQNFYTLEKNIIYDYTETLTKLAQKDGKYYISVNSGNQFNMYFNLDIYGKQIVPIMSLLSRNLNIQDTRLKEIFKLPTDIDIYKELRKYRKEINPEKKIKRNEKRGFEITKYIKSTISKNIDMNIYCHLDYGGNDGSVASEIAKKMSLKKENIFSADIEKWLGNVKKNQFENISYTLLNENQSLPYNNNSFDSISCLQVFHHIEFLNFYLKELFRILKPGGILIIREHDCLNSSNQILIDIEHVIHEYVVPDTPNDKIFDTYYAFYKSYKELNSILEKNGFVYVKSNYNFDEIINPTRYYYSIYKKQ